MRYSYIGQLVLQSKEIQDLVTWRSQNYQIWDPISTTVVVVILTVIVKIIIMIK